MNLRRRFPLNAIVPAVLFLLGGARCSVVAQKTTDAPAGISGNSSLAEPREGVAAPRPAADFSRSNSISIFFGEEDQSNGLKLIDWKADGQSSKVHVGDVPCRCLKPNPPDRAEAYFYFSMDPTFKTRGVQYVKIEIEYFDVVLDETPSVFWIHYDGSGFAGSNPRYSDASPRVRLQGSNMWQTAVFHIRKGTFANAQNGKADFRIAVRPPDLYLRRVTVTREEAGNPIVPLRR